MGGGGVAMCSAKGEASSASRRDLWAPARNNSLRLTIHSSQLSDLSRNGNLQPATQPAMANVASVRPPWPVVASQPSRVGHVVALTSGAAQRADAT